MFRSIQHALSTNNLTLGLADKGAELPAAACSAVRVPLRIGGFWRRKSQEKIQPIGTISLHTVDQTMQITECATPSLSSVGLEWRLRDLKCNSAATDDRRSFSWKLDPLQGHGIKTTDQVGMFYSFSL